LRPERVHLKEPAATTPAEKKARIRLK